MRRPALALIAFGAIAGLVGSARAGLLTAIAIDDVTPVALTCVGGTNTTLVCSGDSTNYANINLAAQGTPTLPSPDLSSLTINATAATGGTHTLTVQVFQTLISEPPPNNMTSTFTINHLIGAPFGPSTLSSYVNGTSSTLGTQIASNTFAAGDTNASVSIDSFVAGTITADAVQYVVQTTGANQSMTDTIQLVKNVPEPGTLALLGMGILGLGMVRYKRN